MTPAIESTAERRSPSPSTLRVRRHRERRREKLRLLIVEVPEPVIQEASARGLLASEEYAEPWTVIQACHAAQLSDAALDWLMRKEIIRRKQSADVVAILRCISDWLERAE
jgi:hypothetical protein